MLGFIKVQPIIRSDLLEYVGSTKGGPYKSMMVARDEAKFFAAKDAWEKGFEFIKINDLKIFEDEGLLGYYRFFKPKKVKRYNRYRRFYFRIFYTAIRNFDMSVTPVEFIYNKHTVGLHNKATLQKIVERFILASLVIAFFVSVIF